MKTLVERHIPIIPGKCRWPKRIFEKVRQSTRKVLWNVGVRSTSGTSWIIHVVCMMEAARAMWMALEADEQWRQRNRASFKGFTEDGLPQLAGLWPPVHLEDRILGRAVEFCEVDGAEIEE